MTDATLELGRTTLDAHGIRRRALFGLLGRSFDLSWSALTGWAVGADVVVSREHPEGRVVQWILELDHAAGMEVIRWGGAEARFHAFAAAVAERRPDIARPPRVGRTHNGRLPKELAWMVGDDRD